MKKKDKVITYREQVVAVDILEDLIATNVQVPEGFYRKIMDRYRLMTDPFTMLPCTCSDWARNQAEYDRQVMFARYGHCDGLD